MPNQRYNRGAAFERKVVDLFRSIDFFACRAGGSHGIADVVAISVNKEKVYFIQCKTDGNLSFEEWNKLVSEAGIYGAVPVLASKDVRGGVRLEWLTDMTRKYARDKPKSEFSVLQQGGGGAVGANSGDAAELPQVHQAGDGAAVGGGSAVEAGAGAG